MTLKNFKLQRQAKFRYATGDIGDVVEIDVYYKKGGSNAFTSRNEPRGIYCSIGRVEIKEVDAYEGQTVRMRTVAAFSHPTFFVQSLKMQAPRKLEAFVAYLDEISVTVAAEYQTDPVIATKHLRELVEAYKLLSIVAPEKIKSVEVR